MICIIYLYVTKHLLPKNIVFNQKKVFQKVRESWQIMISQWNSICWNLKLSSESKLFGEGPSRNFCNPGPDQNRLWQFVHKTRKDPVRLLYHWHWVLFFLDPTYVKQPRKLANNKATNRTLGEKVKNLINDWLTDHFFEQGSNRDLLFLHCLKGTQCI